MLIIYLHTDDYAFPSWVLIGSDGTILNQTHHGHPEDLATLAIAQKIFVLVPAEDVTLTAITLPKMSRSRLRQAIPFALEEQMITDVEQLHFAIGDKKGNEALPVAVVSKEKMQEWLLLLQSWHIQPDVLCPATLALPLEENVWHIILDDIALVRTGLYQGFACDKNNFKACLSIALESTSVIPREVHVHYYTHENDNEKLLLPMSVKVDFHHPDHFVSDLAKQLLSLPTVNLLQNDYRVTKSQFPQRKKLWRMLGYLGVGLLSLLILSPLVSYFILSQRVSETEAEIANIYHRHFPEAKTIVAPKLRMDDLLQKVSSQLGESKGLLWIGYIGKGISLTPSIQLKHLEFQNNQLTLELTAASSEDIANFADYLSQQGLTVKQQNANLTGSRVSATIVID